MSVTALPDSRAALPLVAPHVHRTPLLASRTLSEETGFDVRLKAELFQRTGSYKIRGPLVKLARLSQEERDRGVVCSSAGNHAQGVALAAAMLGVRAVVCMADERDALEDRGDPRLRRRGRPPRLDLGRGGREGARAGRLGRA